MEDITNGYLTDVLEDYASGKTLPGQNQALGEIQYTKATSSTK